MREFKSKVAVITGAASGIGYGIAEHCAREGMRIVLADIERGALTKTERNIKAMGAEALAVRTDVSKAKDVEALSQKTLDAFGAVHLLFNNAGVGPVWTAWGSSLADWQWILGVNLWGVIYGVHLFVPIMLKQDTEVVFDAIRENKFYVLPNADLFRPMIRARLEDTAQERNPTAVP
jgi:NADP-dependent 3-hydroxy acid dehydrogenase YdfG